MRGMTLREEVDEILGGYENPVKRNPADKARLEIIARKPGRKFRHRYGYRALGERNAALTGIKSYQSLKNRATPEMTPSVPENSPGGADHLNRMQGLFWKRPSSIDISLIIRAIGHSDRLRAQ